MTAEEKEVLQSGLYAIHIASERLWSQPRRQVAYIIGRMQQVQDIWDGKEPRAFDTPPMEEPS